MGQGRAQIYNLISLLFIVLTVAALVLVGARMAAPAPVPTQSAAVPTSAILPSPTMTFTFTPTFTPTRTETPLPATFTLTPTVTPTLTWTIIPTMTASLTYTPGPTNTDAPPPTDGPSPTVDLSATATFTPTEAPTSTPVPTEPPPLVYELRDEQVIYTGNFANAAGCAWQGVGGQVFDADDQPLLDVRVHVFGTGIDVFTTSGSNTLYGLSGWEVPLGTTLNSNSYIVEVQSADGAIISPQINLFFTSDCAKNLALVSFQQIS